MSQASPGYSHELGSLVAAFRQHLRHLSERGWKGWECSQQALSTLEGLSDCASQAPELVMDDPGACVRCGLSGTRTNVVFGKGPQDARLMFVMDVPDYEADLTGEPFSGKTGDLLSRMIQAMKFSVDEVYVTSLVKCRPPQNRAAEPGEMEACLPMLHRQIAEVSPEVVVALGPEVASRLVVGDIPAQCRPGEFQPLGPAVVMPTHSLSRLLRQPNSKRDTWEHLKQVAARLGRPVG
ncbi:MAG: uracil-DNA glycosylase [Desulfatibacillaceae bacterium]